MSISYNPKTSIMLAQACGLTYTQYQMGKDNPSFNGTIPPDHFPIELKGFKQTASFKAPELSFTTHQGPAAAMIKSERDLTDKGVLAELAGGVKEVYFGFALEATDGSGNCIIALRGTQNPYEWAMDGLCLQCPIPLVWFEDKKLEFAKAHLGFLTLFAFLYEQITTAAKRFSNPKICYVTGHSLGAALAVLAALALGTVVLPLGGRDGKVQLYNYAGPRVGAPAFADAYDFFLPYSYRVVNLTDLVPMVPPEKIGGLTYQHIGAPVQEWSYLNQTGDIGNNHNLQKNYLQALQASPAVVTNAPRTYPVSGLPG
jgi:hypothetical protein